MYSCCLCFEGMVVMLNATYCPRQRNAVLFLCCEESSRIFRSSFVHGQRKTVGQFPKYSTNDSAMRWNPVHQQHWLIVVPLLRRTKLLPVFSRREGWVVSLWTAPGRELLDGNSATWTWSSTNTAVSQPKQCLRVWKKEVNSTLFDWLESGWTTENWWTASPEKNQDVCVFI